MTIDGSRRRIGAVNGAEDESTVSIERAMGPERPMVQASVMQPVSTDATEGRLQPARPRDCKAR